MAVGVENLSLLGNDEVRALHEQMAAEALRRGLVSPMGEIAVAGSDGENAPYHAVEPVEFIVDGAGKMGGYIAERAARGGHKVTVYDKKTEVAEEIGGRVEGCSYTTSLKDAVASMRDPIVWFSLPSGRVTRNAMREIAGYMFEEGRGGLMIDAANTFYVDDFARKRWLARQQRGVDPDKRVFNIDSGTSGGIWGKERGYSLMLGGREADIDRLDELWRTLSPGVAAATRTPGRKGEPHTAEWGYLRCGSNGAGHFVKMVHNGIEYGMMSSVAQGLGLIKRASDIDANAPGDLRLVRKELLDGTEDLRYFQGLGLTNLGDITEVWRRGSVVSSWLIDLMAQKFIEKEGLNVPSWVPDSGEGRWTEEVALKAGYPVPTLAAATHERFATRGGEEIARILNALRNAFGGHVAEKD